MLTAALTGTAPSAIISSISASKHFSNINIRAAVIADTRASFRSVGKA